MKARKSSESDWLHELERKVFSTMERAGDSEGRKTLDEVFDMRTLTLLSKLISNGVIDTLDFPISTGKEGNVFKATSPDGEDLAVKIYRTSNANFKKITSYILGDPRFHGVTNNRRKLIAIWCMKEYKNLLRLTNAGVRVPEPRKALENVLVMEYIGNKENPAPILKNVRPEDIEDPEGLYRTILQNMRLAFQEANFVHADMSEYNILYWEKEACIIDVAQGVLAEHPRAKEWLTRDVLNICNFFRRLGVEADKVLALSYIRGVEK